MKSKISEELKKSFSLEQVEVLEKYFKKIVVDIEKSKEKENNKVLDKSLTTLEKLDLAKKDDLRIERLKLEMEIQEVKGELQKDVTILKGDLELKIQAVKNDLIKWYIGGMIALGGFLFAILTHFLK